MIIKLIKNGEDILSATTDHRKGNGGHHLPVAYDGDTSLLPSGMESASVTLLESMFSLIANKHGFELAGDYLNVRTKHRLRIPSGGSGV